MLEEVKMLMMKVVAEVANALEKKTKLNNIHEEGIHIEGIETNTTQSGIEGQGTFSFKERGKEKFVHTSGEGVQANLNQLYEKGDKDKVDDQFAEFWYPSVIPFDVIKNPAFAKFSDMVEILWLPRLIFVMPPINLLQHLLVHHKFK